MVFIYLDKELLLKTNVEKCLEIKQLISHKFVSFTFVNKLKPFKIHMFICFEGLITKRNISRERWTSIING